MAHLPPGQTLPSPTLAHHYLNMANEAPLAQTLNQILGAIQGLTTQVAQVEMRMDRRLQSLETRMDKRMDGLETRMDGLEARMYGLETRMNNRFEWLETRMNDRFEWL